MCHPEWGRARAGEQRLEDLARLRRVRDRIDREYVQPLNVEALARGAHMSAGHLSRQFRQAYGETVYAYLMTRRIERAAALLRRGDLSVTEVCFAVGCSSLGTFSTRFTELVGMPPSTYRRQATHRADAATDTDAGADTGTDTGASADTSAGAGMDTGTDTGARSASGAAVRAADLAGMAGMPACVAKQVTRPVRNRRAPAPEPQPA